MKGKRKSNRAKIRPWTSEETVFLQSNYQSMTSRQLAENLGRSWESVRGKMKEKQLIVGEDIRKARQQSRRGMPYRSRNKGFSWNEENETFLRDNYAMMPNPDLAQAIGTTVSGVFWRARAMGLKKDPQFRTNLVARLLDIRRGNMVKRQSMTSEEREELRRQKAARRSEKVLARMAARREAREMMKMEKQKTRMEKKMKRLEKAISELSVTRTTVSKTLTQIESNIKSKKKS
jgi:hypothetical protein